MSECKYFCGYDPSGTSCEVMPQVEGKEYGMCYYKGHTRNRVRDLGCVCVRVLPYAVNRNKEEKIPKPVWCECIRARRRDYCNS